MKETSIQYLHAVRNCVHALCPIMFLSDNRPNILAAVCVFIVNQTD